MRTPHIPIFKLLVLENIIDKAPVSIERSVHEEIKSGGEMECRVLVMLTQKCLASTKALARAWTEKVIH